MYQAFFGFTQQPFSIAPDPRFLFLGPRHQEALAHLHHGLMGSGGFLLLTGEVGTGKTTLSRAILGQLEDQLNVVFILNPRLSEQELLASIAQGFGIEGVDEADSLKSLTDAIATFLTTSAQAGKHPVVLIDEAQHLYPAALEQLRLLTNLESDAKKLLSVVLIGQPELRELLQRQELRQVAQRIVARYQLLPFTQTETNAYIDHRLTVAQGAPSIFSEQARKYIWQWTQGTPRLINLLCDRALQLAAMSGRKQIDKRIMQEAADILPLAKAKETSPKGKRSWPWAMAAAVGVVAFAMWQFVPIQPTTQSEPTPTEEVQTSSRHIYGQPLQDSLSKLAALWQLGSMSLGQQPCERLARYNLVCVHGHANLANVSTLNVPALAFLHDGGSVVLRGQQNNQWLLQDAEGEIRVAESELANALSGEYLLFVSPPPFVNEAHTEAWRTWVSARLKQRVPLSLQQSDIEQQRTWLMDTAQGLSDDDGWLFALLASSGDYQGPQLRSVAVEDYPSERPLVEESQIAEQVRYGTRPLTLTDIHVPTFTMHWPTEPQEEHVSQAPESAAQEEPIAEAEVGSKKPDSNATADTLEAIFEQAVRATPERPAETRWSFDLDEPTQQMPAQQQGVPLLSELTAEQRQQLPKLSYDQHVYQSRPEARWIGLGQQRLAEGEQLQGLRVISIQPNYSILSWGDLLFRVEALENM
ncbi:hypothetical protein CWE15_09410 [Aliidiomarina taiwanensis]|uniref:AAA+ ATPase domain-containing protein n=1 Tax=Aliidiomarina taiwanensis TaxID=946228 RepID=A0A432WZY7_9GAMM|nr:AAA family ATPase [Aliidiomarina taiwanensis]RUO39334.1 hypothetical protein CWE15_09410 [Aliidiomarina taiwanensis]